MALCGNMQLAARLKMLAVEIVQYNNYSIE